MAKTKVAVSVGDLVRAALLAAANGSDGAKLSGKGGLFSSAKGANTEAIAECLSAEKPLLAVTRKEGKSEFVGLTPAGFERIAGALDETQAGPLAKSIAVALPPAARAEFLQSVISRTPLAAAELLPTLEEAVAAEKAEQEARIAAAAKRRAAEEASLKALERAKTLIEERHSNRLAALRREWEAEGRNPAELTEPEPKTDHETANGKPRP